MKSKNLHLPLVCLAFVLATANLSVAAETTVATSVTSTAGQRPSQNAIVLFDGSDLDAWRSQKDRHWEETDGPADWRITPEGWLEVVPGAGSLITEKQWSDFTLHLEFKLPPTEVNGGVFLLARYELGISGTSSGSRCGGFDNLSRKLDPASSADLKPGEWQALDVEFRSPRLGEDKTVLKPAQATVRLNGELIHDQVELGPRKGAAKRLGDASSGPLMLQEHGATYWFRNIWLMDRAVSPR